SAHQAQAAPARNLLVARAPVPPRTLSRGSRVGQSEFDDVPRPPCNYPNGTRTSQGPSWHQMPDAERERMASSRLSHSPMRFQLANIRLTSSNLLIPNDGISIPNSQSNPPRR